MDPSKNLEENLDEFKKITVSLANIDERISDENQAIIILNSLTDSYKDLKVSIKYGRESLFLDDVLGALKLRDLEMKSERKENSESLQLRGRPHKRDQSKGRGKSRSKSKGKRTCWHCHKECHFRRNCPERKKNQNGFLNTDSVNVTNVFEMGEVLIVSKAYSNEEWILDSACTHDTKKRFLV